MIPAKLEPRVKALVLNLLERPDGNMLFNRVTRTDLNASVHRLRPMEISQLPSF